MTTNINGVTLYFFPRPYSFFFYFLSFLKNPPKKIRKKAGKKDKKVLAVIRLQRKKVRIEMRTFPGGGAPSPAEAGCDSTREKGEGGSPPVTEGSVTTKWREGRGSCLAGAVAFLGRPAGRLLSAF